jgi:two-component sensor histidine kinase
LSQDLRDQHVAGIRPPVWIAGVLAWWTVQGLATGSQYRFLMASEGMEASWGSVMLIALASAYLWVPLTALAFWLTWRYPLEAGRWGRRVWVHLFAGLGAHLFRAGAVVVFNPAVGWYPEQPPSPQQLAQNLANNIFLYWLIAGAAHALFYARRAQERASAAERLRADLVRTELANLRSRLHPHFLFNALNTIASLVRDRPDAAERVVTRLSELLRRALENTADDRIPLEEELTLARAYLDVEQARFEDRLRVVWRIDAEVEQVRVPALVLQPLVENAVRHGLAQRRDGGTIEISAARSNGMLRVVVRDDGVGRGAASAEGRGIGLGETRARLAAVYGPDASLTLSHPQDGGAVVELTVPFGDEADRRADRANPADRPVQAVE